MEQLNRIIESLKKLLGIKKKNMESQGEGMGLRIMKRTSTALGSLHGKYANAGEDFTTGEYQVAIKKQLYVRRPIGTVVDGIRSKK